ncbi:MULTISPECIES: ATP-dependent Clp protease ATP-binding subunit [Mediterranea]|uniref:ATP-dependent Clp protease ATP-binding subunit n=1 Tax=Mediterranea TaxID=1926659 RepID=UPI002012756A|nr:MULTISPECIES: ATP-dependent Clp protease ATP-binding subunit [Mediterranea]MCL1607715.1 ATP-dependent Clp protease ATP-binding subunit [Mediterranea sp. ET5]MDM8123256.1 ATP-dependent Clp protease ATP-binding subunit [Mediterranea massiliensis]MDM8197309.1 ATP-dependent Clp protease ATP-binding subunit [Mediterranea massiliensis]
MNNQFSQKVSEILIYSKQEAIRLNSDHVGPEHLLLGLLKEGSGRAIEVLQKKLYVDLGTIKNEIEARIEKQSNDYTYSHARITNENEVMLDETSARILRLGILEARLLKKEVVSDEHLLLAILKQHDNMAAQVLERNDVTYSLVFEELSLKQADVNAGMNGYDEDEEDAPGQSNGNNNLGNGQQVQQTQTKRPINDTPTIDMFGMDLTKAAELGRLDPVVGREKEIERLAQILSRRKKNNPVLIGEPGVGKSAIVEGLALRIIEKKVSRVLFNKRVVSLDMTSVVAGTKYRGQFEERIRTILKELKDNPDVILFIDEIHTIVGAGSAPGSMDAANMLKPALARGEIQCIGATTLDEYRKSIEKDGALERRFQKVIVEPTSPEETLQILKNIKEKYEDHHNVSYTQEALEACVKLTGRYISDRNFPDKAIDALDEAGSRVHLTNISVPKEIEEQEQEIDRLKQLRMSAVKAQNYELAANYRDKEKSMQLQLDEMKRIWEESLKDNREVVDEGQIADVVSMMSGVPVQRMAQAESIRLKGMREALTGKIIAQDAAVDKLVRAIQRSRVGLKDPNRPIGTFMFLGPTGVGKTLLAKELATYMFGSSDALIRIDMSEYMEKFTVSRLVGAPPGYVGYEEGGQLTEKVRRRPYSIILLDEIEKAHGDVFNLLLQVMDEGRLTDSYGRTIDFKNTVIIMTSNIGTRQLKEFGRGIGFSALLNVDDDKEHSRSIIQKALNKSFAPEFLNRIDEIITFDQLDRPAIRRIVDLELAQLMKRVENLGYKLEVTDEVKDFISDHGFDIQFGARPLRRAIQTYLEDGISELFINDSPVTGSILKAAISPAQKDKLAFTVLPPIKVQK